MATTTSPRPALAAAFSSTEFAFAGTQPQPTGHSFPASAVRYIGEPLFCNTTIAGGTLNIRIGPNETQSLLPAQNPRVTAQFATVTIQYKNFHDVFTQQVDYTGSRLTFSMQLDSTLASAHIVIGEEDAQNPISNLTDGSLEYVLVQQDPSNPISPYSLYWTFGDPDDLVIRNFKQYTTAGVVLPPGSGGGLAGPMGLFTP